MDAFGRNENSGANNAADYDWDTAKQANLRLEADRSGGVVASGPIYCHSIERLQKQRVGIGILLMREKIFK